MAQFSIAPHSDVVARRGAVLVVEDRNDVRQAMAQLLELHGFLVEDARNAEEALTQLYTEPDGFALILLDLLLPGGLSGWDFRARQLADPRIAHIPTIVVTVSDDVDSEKRDALRFDGWLEKPFRCADLLKAVRRYVVSEGSALQAES